MKKCISLFIVLLTLVISSTCLANGRIVNETTGEYVEMECKDQCQNIQFSYFDSNGNMEIIGQTETKPFLKVVNSKSKPEHHYYEDTKYTFVDYDPGFIEGTLFKLTWGVIIIAKDSIIAIPTAIIDIFDGKNSNIFNLVNDSWEDCAILDVKNKEFQQLIMFIKSYISKQ